jgi:hypothetical protein
MKVNNHTTQCAFSERARAGEKFSSGKQASLGRKKDQVVQERLCSPYPCLFLLFSHRFKTQTLVDISMLQLTYASLEKDEITCVKAIFARGTKENKQRNEILPHTIANLNHFGFNASI